jgi:hypothetical protein
MSKKFPTLFPTFSLNLYEQQGKNMHNNFSLQGSWKTGWKPEWQMPLQFFLFFYMIMSIFH